MSETYNPRENTFIKKPELKICPTCGNPMTPEVKPMGTHMNNYMNAETGKIYGSMNSNEDMVEVAGVKLYKVDGGTLKVPTSSFIPGTSNVPVKPVEKLPILTANPVSSQANSGSVASVTLPTDGTVIKTSI